MLVGAVAAGPVAAFCFAAQGASSCMQHLPRGLNSASVAGRVLVFLFMCFHKNRTILFECVLSALPVVLEELLSRSLRMSCKTSSIPTKLACRAGAVVSVQILTIHSVTHVLHVKPFVYLIREIDL